METPPKKSNGKDRPGRQSEAGIIGTSTFGTGEMWGGGQLTKGVGGPPAVNKECRVAIIFIPSGGDRGRIVEEGGVTFEEKQHPTQDGNGIDVRGHEYLRKEGSSQTSKLPRKGKKG